MKNRMMKPEHVSKSILLGSVGLVTASTAVLPIVTGYGTILSQFVVLGSWSIVAAVTSGAFAYQNHFYLWLVAAILNVILFSVPAIVMFWLLRHRAPRICVVLLAVWLLFYAASLFFLFPATDGP